MKKLLPEKLANLTASPLLAKVKDGAAKLLPQAAARPALQLPIPQTPFDKYRRQKLIKLMRMHELVPYRSVLEIGCGIGDLMLEMSKHQPRELYGVDGSEEMIGFARQLLEGTGADLMVADVRRLPFPEKSFDVVVVMFELQFLPEEKEMERVVYEVCRLARQWVVLVEETAQQESRSNSIARRTVAAYKEAFKTKRFHLRRADYLDVSASQYVFTGRSNPWHWLRWLLSPLLYLMGFPRAWFRPPVTEHELPKSRFALFLQQLALPLMTGLDDIVKTGSGITVMRFERERLFRRG